METVFVRSPYNYDRDLVSEETGLECKDPSRTQQHQKEDADINTIVKRFGLTGELPPDLRTPQYGDFTGITDYQTALNAVKAADEAFMQLPGDLRAKFNNDPEQYVAFCTDPANIPEMIKLGLAKDTTPAGTPVATPTPDATTPKAAS